MTVDEELKIVHFLFFVALDYPFGGYGSFRWLPLFWIFPSLPWM